MKNLRFGVYSLSLCCVLTWSIPAMAEKYKVGYFEAGFSSIYKNSMHALNEALAEKGWRDKVEYPKDASFSPGFGKKHLAAREAAVKKLMARTDLAMIISAGTGATKIIQKYNNKKIPILGIAISDPIRSKFVIDQNDTGLDNFTTRLVPGRYKRMFQIFHDEVGYKRLGLLYVDSDNGKKFANVEDAIEVSKERGFEIVHYKINDTLKPEECMQALESLVAQKIDAFYMPSLTCFEWHKYDVNKYLTYLRDNKVPTFARQGSEDVKAGALMGFSTVDYSQRGSFLADKMIDILKGGSPRKQKMVDEAPPKIAINLHAAKQIGFDPSFEILGASDEIYNEITLPESRLVK